MASTGAGPGVAPGGNGSRAGRPPRPHDAGDRERLPLELDSLENERQWPLGLDGLADRQQRARELAAGRPTSAARRVQASPCGRLRGPTGVAPAYHPNAPAGVTVRRRTAVGPLTADQQELVLRHIGLVGMHLRNRVRTSHHPRSGRERADLFQTGCLALVRAAAGYNPARHGSFAPYALPRIRGAIFTALHEHFATIRIPVDVLVQAKKDVVRHGRRTSPLLPMAYPMGDLDSRPARGAAPDEDSTCDGTTIRGCVRLRFERAVAAALVDLRHRKWKRRNPTDAISFIASHRLLVPSSEHRASIRKIAATLGLSRGRVTDYETMLREAVKRRLADDPQLQLLFEFAAQDRSGMDGRITPQRREMLVRAEVTAFAAQLASMTRSQQAELLYHLVEQSDANPAEVIRHLHHLAVCRDLPAAPTT